MSENPGPGKSMRHGWRHIPTNRQATPQAAKKPRRLPKRDARGRFTK